MSLATRCTACGTIFRVVQDQLKVSEGWVRCGRCQQVFNALQNLFDLDREQPPPWPPVGAPAPAPAAAAAPAAPTPTWTATQPLGRPVGAGAAPASGSPPAPATARGTAPAPSTAPALTPQRAVPGAASAPRPAATAAAVTPGSPTLPARAAAAAAAARVATSARAPGPGGPAPSTQSLLHVASREPEAGTPLVDAGARSTQPEPDDEGESSGFLHARFNLDLVDHAPSPGPASAALAALHGGVAATSGAAAAREPAPQFVRLAERAARWQQPRVRALLALLLLLSVLALLGQIALQFRAPLAAAWPESRALLDPMCDWLGCTIGPPRRLDSLTVDASGLSRTPTPGVYRLSVALHNHSHTIVMVPAVELSLTDAHGQLFARRALRPEDLGVTQPAIPAGGDLTLQAQLSTGAERVVGYTVEIFYP